MTAKNDNKLDWSNVSYFPNWKPKATAAERFMELAAIAAKEPEKFGEVIVLYEEKIDDHRTKMRTIYTRMSINEVLGRMVIAQQEIIDFNTVPR